MRAGIRDIVINHAWLGHMIEDALGDGAELGATIRYSAETTALETAGGIKQALPLLGTEPFLLINGDVWVDEPYETFTAAVLSKQDKAHLWLVSNPEHNPTGDFLLKSGRVQDSAPAGDVADQGCQTLTFSGISVIRPELVAELNAGKHPLAPLLRQAMEQGLVAGDALPADCGWVDVGTPERLKQLHEQLTQRI